MKESGKFSKFKSFFIELLETFLTTLIVLFIIYATVAMPEQVVGASMEPNFHTGERILVEKLTKHFKSFERGDVVVLNPPGNESSDYIKRIIGIPGDIVKVFDCQVYISTDGKKYVLDETYLPERTCTSEGPRLKEGRSIKIEENEYLVLGDNRARSSDSRYFGLVEANSILGRVIFRFWPLDKLGFI